MFDMVYVLIFEVSCSVSLLQVVYLKLLSQQHSLITCQTDELQLVSK